MTDRKPVQKKKRKHVKPKQSSSEVVSWSDVPAKQIQWIVTTSFDLECLTSFSGRRDLTSLSIRVWHPDVDIEPIYFTPTAEGRIPDKVIDFFTEIAHAVDKDLPASYDFLWNAPE